MGQITGASHMASAQASEGALPSESALTLVERLIAIPTVSRDSNLGLIELARDHLRAFGAVTWLDYDASGQKANLLAKLGDSQEGMLLSGHTDVVPVDGQAWTSSPFVPTTKDGLLFGRGSADMKGFLGIALSLAPFIVEHGRTVLFALSYDEELGCLGAPGLMRLMDQCGVTPTGCIVGEPTSMQPVVGHKGSAAYRCCVRGREAHAALTNRGANAIHAAAKLIHRIDEIALGFAKAEPAVAHYAVPHSTASVNLINGGIASNVVAQSCDFSVDLRHTAYTDPDKFAAQVRSYANSLTLGMREVAPESRIDVDQTVSVPSFEMEEGAPFVSRIGRLLSTGQPKRVDFGSEAGFFRQRGIPTVLCGPGSIEQAHKPDEFVPLADLHRCEFFLKNLLTA